MGTVALPAPAGGVLAGYAAPWDRRADGVLDAPEAHALVLESDELRVGLVTLDVLIARPELRPVPNEDPPARRDPQDLSLDQVVVIATHTHSGPGGYMPGWIPERLSMGSFRPEAAGELRDAARRALARAVANLAPALVSSGTARVQLAANRRHSDGAHETALPLLRFDFGGREAPVVLFAYGAHPSVLSPKSHAYSADYPGMARAWLRERGWRPVFVPGPLGDQVPVSALGPLWETGPEGQRAQAREIGAALGRAVLTGLRALPPPAPAELRAIESWVEAPPTRARRFCPLWWLGPLGRRALAAQLSARVPVAGLRIGRADLLALPAEPVSSVGEEIRAQIGPGRDAFVIVHANDWLGYAVSERDYAEGSYEACMSFHGPGFGAWLVDAASGALRLLDSLP